MYNNNGDDDDDEAVWEYFRDTFVGLLRLIFFLFCSLHFSLSVYGAVFVALLLLMLICISERDSKYVFCVSTNTNIIK